MATVYIDGGNNIHIVLHELQKQCSAPLGKLLFSFLEIDLHEYNDLYQKYFLHDTVSRKDVEYLIKRYPETAKNKCLMDIVSSYDGDIETGIVYPFLTDNLEAFVDIYSHNYLTASKTFLEFPGNVFKHIRHDINLQEMQDTIKELIQFCFLDSYSKEFDDLTAEQKYYIFCASKTDPWKYTKEMRYGLGLNMRDIEFYKQLPDYFCNLRHNNGGNIDFSQVDPKIFKYVKQAVSLSYVSKCEFVREFAFWEFYLLLSTNANVKRCSNCGRLFICNGNYNTSCCDRIQEGTQKTCREIMTQKKYKEKISSNPILKEYEKAYKRNYARATHKKISKESFRAWAEEAANKRDVLSAKYLADPDENLVKEFKQYLGNR